MGDLPRYKKMDLSEPVTVTLPAHIWMSFAAAYQSTDWADPYASLIAKTAQEEMLDPIYIRERQAAMQQQRDEHKSIFDAMFTGRPPEVPPNMEDPS